MLYNSCAVAIIGNNWHYK